MAVEDPGTLTVTCDGCGETVEAETTSYAGEPATFGVDDSTLEALDWLVVEGETFCPECKDEPDEDE